MSDTQFQQLMKVLGAVGGQAYEAAYRQAYIDGVLFIVLGVVLVGVAVVSLRFTIKNWHNESVSGTQTTLALIGVIFSLLIPALLFTGISDILNPQWYAIQSLARLVTK